MRAIDHEDPAWVDWEARRALRIERLYVACKEAIHLAHTYTLESDGTDPRVDAILFQISRLRLQIASLRRARFHFGDEETGEFRVSA